MSAGPIQIRMKTERDRLGLTMAAVAEHMRVSTSAVHRWESSAFVSAGQLYELWALGYDPQFVITGIRSPNVWGGVEITSRGRVDDQELVSDEVNLLRLVRAIKNKKGVRTMLEALAQSEGVDPASVNIKGGVRMAGRDYYEK